MQAANAHPQVGNVHNNGPEMLHGSDDEGELFQQEAQWTGPTTTGILLTAGDRSRGQGRKRSHAPQELCQLWAFVAHRF